MLKKTFVVLILGVVAATGAFCAAFSVGGGATISSTSWNLSASAGGSTVTAKDAILPFGAKVFLDATYIEVSVGYIMSVNATGSGTGMTTTTLSNNLGYVTFAALGKYPFKVGSFSVFPLLGAEYDLNVIRGNPDNFEGAGGLLASPTAGDFNQLWLKGGVGVKIPIGGKLYMQPEALYGYKLLNSDEQSVVSAFQALGATASLNFSTLDFALLVGYSL